MSFNFQGPSERPIIQGAQNMMNNGGGGNLGYFQGRQKKKDDESNKNLFNSQDEDSFTLSSGKGEEELPEDINNENSAMKNIKGFFGKLMGKPEENK